MRALTQSPSSNNNEQNKSVACIVPLSYPSNHTNKDLLLRNIKLFSKHFVFGFTLTADSIFSGLEHELSKTQNRPQVDGQHGLTNFTYDAALLKLLQNSTQYLQHKKCGQPTSGTHGHYPEKRYKEILEGSKFKGFRFEKGLV